MAAQMDNFHCEALGTGKMHHLQTEGEAELLNKWNLFVESKQSTDSKICISSQNPRSHGGVESFKELKKIIDKMYVKERKPSEEMLKVQKNTIYKVKTVESNIKPSMQSKKSCFCSPTSHEGSFRCRYHRINAAKRAATANKSSLSINSKLNCDNSSNPNFNSRRNGGAKDFKPMLSRFGRAACSEVLPHDSLIPQSASGLCLKAELNF